MLFIRWAAVAPVAFAHVPFAFHHMFSFWWCPVQELPVWQEPPLTAPSFVAPCEPKPVGFLRGCGPVLIMDVSGTMHPARRGQFHRVKSCVSQLLQPQGEHVWHTQTLNACLAHTNTQGIFGTHKHSRHVGHTQTLNCISTHVGSMMATCTDPVPICFIPYLIVIVTTVDYCQVSLLLPVKPLMSLRLLAPHGAGQLAGRGNVLCSDKVWRNKIQK